MSSPHSAPPYLTLTLLFLFLSLTGVGLIGYLVPNSGLPFITGLFPASSFPAPSPVLISTPIPTVSSPTSATASPSPKPSLPPASPTPSILVYQNTVDNFTLSYSSARKLYEDKEASGVNRYTFYLPDSSFAVHIGSAWSWVHPSRTFTDTPLSGYPTFRFQTDTQLIVDLETPLSKITLQCIHHNKAKYITECQQFINSFRTPLPTPTPKI